MIHYRVTPAFWRGVWRLGDAAGFSNRRRLRRACDWMPLHLNDSTASLGRITCEPCLAYRKALERLGKCTPERELWRRAK